MNEVHIIILLERQHMVRNLWVPVPHQSLTEAAVFIWLRDRLGLTTP
jgi:hypothetical protein